MSLLTCAMHEEVAVWKWDSQPHVYICPQKLLREGCTWTPLPLLNFAAWCRTMRSHPGKLGNPGLEIPLLNRDVSCSFSGRRKLNLLLSQLIWRMSCTDLFSVAAQHLPRKLELWFQIERLQIHVSPK